MIAKSWCFRYMTEAENIRISGPLHVNSDYQLDYANASVLNFETKRVFVSNNNGYPSSNLTRYLVSADSLRLRLNSYTCSRSFQKSLLQLKQRWLLT